MNVCLDCPVRIPRGSRCTVHHREYLRTKQQRSNAQRGGSGWVWSGIRAQVIARDGGCVMTGDHAGPLRVDHIRPLASGGSNDLANLRTLCLAHHRSVTKNGGG